MTVTFLFFLNMSNRSSVGAEGDHAKCIQCTCMHITAEDEHEEVLEHHLRQNRLNNWERWIRKRKRIHEHLTKCVGRSAGDLIMNISEGYRQNMEEKLIFQYCKINTYFDKYRGNPAFWKMPAGLSDKCDRSLNPIYFAQKTKIEENKIPIVERIASPEYVLKEKNMFPSSRNIYGSHQNCKNENIEMLSSKIHKIERYQPDCKELIIVGEKKHLQECIVDIAEEAVLTENRNSRENEYDTASESSKGKIITKTSLENIISNNCFVINETIFSNCNNFKDGVIKIRLIFDCTTNMKKPEVKYIHFKNIGQTAVRFYWNEIEKILLFQDLILSDREESHSFYFDKNELLLAPEEKIDFPIWFKSNKIGNYFEMWEITTKPTIWDSNFQVIVILQGFAYPDNFLEKSKCINEIVDVRVTNTLIRGVLNDILQHLKFMETETEVFGFTEEQLFESANQEMWGVEKRPKYLYNKNVVAQLKALYEEVKFPDSPKSLNYSIKDLKIITRTRDIWIYVEKKTKEKLKGNQRRNELSKMQENPDERVEVEETERQSSVENDQRETYCRRLDAIIQGLERPSMIMNTNRSKYFKAFSAIRTCLFKMCEALAKYDNPIPMHPIYDCNPSYDYRSITTIEQIPDRLTFEIFDDIWIDRAKKNLPQGKSDSMALPKPDILKDIPIEKSNMVFKVYFNIPDSGDSGKHKKKRSSKEDENGKLNKDTRERGSKINKNPLNMRQSKLTPPPLSFKENFDPFKEENDSKRPSTDSKQSLVSSKLPSVNIHRDDKIGFEYSKYLIVYTHLTDAIMTMVDSLETMKENMVDGEVLENLIRCDETNFRELETKTEELSIEEPNSQLHEDEYFQYLLDSHLNSNLSTIEYLVEGRSKYYCPDIKQSIYQIYQETPESESCSSLFKSPDVSVCSIKPTASAGIQTSDVEGEFQGFSNISLISEINTPTVKSSISEKLSHDIFYFMEEDEEEPKEKTVVL